MKTCSKCKVEKDVGEFPRNNRRADGLNCWCRACHAAYYAANKDKIAARHAAYYAANKDKFAKSGAAYRAANKDKVAEYMSAYQAANKDKLAKRKAAYYAANKDKIAARRAAYRAANKDKFAARDAAYQAANKDKRSAYKKRRRHTEPNYALCHRSGTASRRALKGDSCPGFFRHMPYFCDDSAAPEIYTLPPGTDPAEVCDGSKWHIDHIRPMASFDFTDGKDGEDWQRCWALANLRMLPAEENMAKGNSLCERPTPGECPIQDWIWETERTNKTDDDTHVDEILSNLFDTLDMGRESADTTRGNSAV